MATKIHSRYQRHLRDLPWEGIAVQLQLTVRKFFCQNDDCEQRIFCERLPELVDVYGRATKRLNDLLTLLGYALGGRAGARTCCQLHYPSSARPLLRRVRDEVPLVANSVRILGVDDFALRRGQRYGTMLVDLEHHRVIDLLPDRDATHLEQWLKKHPEIEIVCRDRALAYAEAASKGAPQAVQIADRFHLMKNLTEAFEKAVQRHSALLRQAAQEVSPRYLRGKF